MEKNPELIAFLKSYDFMRLGNLVQQKNWNAAHMAVRRLKEQSEALELQDFARHFANIQRCLGSADQTSILNILTLVTTRRVQLLRLFNEV